LWKMERVEELGVKGNVEADVYPSQWEYRERGKNLREHYKQMCRWKLCRLIRRGWPGKQRQV
jgi:hypothetical protein